GTPVAPGGGAVKQRDRLVIRGAVRPSAACAPRRGAAAAGRPRSPGAGRRGRLALADSATAAAPPRRPPPPAPMLPDRRHRPAAHLSGGARCRTGPLLATRPA